MNNLPILSIITFLPLIGVLLIFACAGRREARSRCIATIADLALSLLLWAHFDGPSRGLPAGREGGLAGRRHHLSHGCGRHFDAVRGADRRPDAVLHCSPAGTRSRTACRNT